MKDSCKILMEKYFVSLTKDCVICENKIAIMFRVDNKVLFSYIKKPNGYAHPKYINSYIIKNLFVDVFSTNNLKTQYFINRMIKKHFPYSNGMGEWIGYK